MWWTKPTFGLQQQSYYTSANTQSADNEPSWKLAIFSMLSVSLHFLTFCDVPRARCLLRFAVNLMVVGCSRIRLYHRTTQLRPVLNYALTLVILLRVWNMVMNAVSDPRTAYRLRGRLSGHSSLGCGDATDITNNGGTTAPETDCNVVCSGNFNYLMWGWLEATTLPVEWCPK